MVLVMHETEFHVTQMAAQQVTAQQNFSNYGTCARILIQCQRDFRVIMVEVFPTERLAVC